MQKRSTRLTITFFSIVLVGFVLVQYCWVRSLQDSKLREFRSRAIRAVAHTNEKKLSAASWHKWSDTTVAALLGQSFSSIGLGGIHFEFSIGSGHDQLMSPGFTQTAATDAGNLVLYHPLRADSQNTDARLTVVIPAWKRVALKGMRWVYAICGALTIMVIAVFCCALILERRRRQYRYDNRTDAVRHLIQQLEISLSTMSVAVEALGNDKVMYNSEKRQFYQEIINVESKRLKERVNKIFKL